MANRLYNKQVSPKGYKAGGSVRDTRKTEQMIGASISSKREKGRTRKMGGGMMMQRPMMKKGGVASEAKKKQFKANQANQKTTTKKAIKVAKTIGKIIYPQYLAGDVASKIKERMGRKMGGSLKPVQPNQKGLSKLPTEVRNKMGYMKKGGVVSDAKKKQFKANQAGQKSFNKKFKFEGDYKGKSLAGKAKEFVKTAAKQHIRAAKKIAKGISGGAKK